MEKSKILILIKSGLIALILLILSFPTYAQNNEQETSNNNTTIDTADDQQDLFDDNTNYKEMYKDLNKDGDWIQMNQSDLDADDDDATVNNDDNGTNVKIIYVWKPRGFDSDWSPYSDGQWVYTYSGWIWSSSYDWGWAAYHYGRWVYYDLYGWVWLPGRYYAPSWVQWCYTPDYIGWYPLYPRWYGWHRHGHHGWHDRYYHRGHHRNWVVVHRNKFTEKISKHNVVDKNKNSEIINGAKTKAIVKYDGKSIINVGPKVSAIEKNTGQKITPKQVNYNGTKGITKIDNNSVSVYRNDLTKKEKVNSENGSRNNTSVKKNNQNNNNSTKINNNNGTKTNNNNGTKTNNNNSTKKNNNNNGTKYNGNNESKGNGNVNHGSKGNNGYNNNRGNEGSHGSKGNTGYNNSSKGNNGNNGSRSNTGNNSSRSNNNNSSRSGDSSKRK
jgi:hypothetical protein